MLQSCALGFGYKLFLGDGHLRFQHSSTHLGNFLIHNCFTLSCVFFIFRFFIHCIFLPNLSPFPVSNHDIQRQPSFRRPPIKKKTTLKLNYAPRLPLLSNNPITPWPIFLKLCVPCLMLQRISLLSYKFKLGRSNELSARFKMM